MNPIETLGLALGAGFSSGLNLYATVATLGLLQHFGVLHLPPGLQPLAHPWVLGIAIALYLLEFVADKIPYFDTVWDAVHTFIRPPAAALLAYAAAGGAAPEWRWGAALIAGGVALNCVLNARIRDHGRFRRVWVQPAAGDAGTSLGAALWIDLQERGETKRAYRMDHAFLDGNGSSLCRNHHRCRTRRALSLPALPSFSFREPRSPALACFLTSL